MATKSEPKVDVIGTGTVHTMPIIIIKRVKSKKGKKKYTRGTKALQDLVLGASEASYRTSNSVSKGLRTFVKRTKKSSRKKRDGSLRDALRNAAIGFGDGVAELGRAPQDLAKRISTRRAWKTFRTFTPSSR